VKRFDWAAIAPGLTLKMSIGVVDMALFAWTSHGIAAADALLCEARRHGRNHLRY
jgi:hypothetical protein